jgi:hypothetical protein
MEKMRFVCTKNVALIKKDLLAEKQDLFEKKVRKSPFLGKKVLCYKKTGIAKAKKYKNRIFLRKKGDNKKRKKKDFFPPLF